jgi:V8-like Glu-specific endopeptidase
MKYFCLVFMPFIFSLKVISAPTIYGEFDRKKNTDFLEGAQYIGRLKTRNGFCTAGLVGKDLIVTAGHCVQDVRTKSHIHELQFELMLNNYAAKEISSITEVESPYTTLKIWTKHARDWAILRLKKPLGRKYGYFKIRSTTNLINDDPRLSISGYSSINPQRGSMYTQQGCNFRQIKKRGKILNHDCDAGPGDSGAPLYECDNAQDCYIYALHVASEKDMGEVVRLFVYDSNSFLNTACSSINFQKELKEIQKKSPRDILI